MAKEPESLEEALEIIEDLREELEVVRQEISTAEYERNDLQDQLDDLAGGIGLQEAAAMVLGEIQRPVGRIHEVTLPDSPAARRALRALSDAAGKGV